MEKFKDIVNKLIHNKYFWIALVLVLINVLLFVQRQNSYYHTTSWQDLWYSLKGDAKNIGKTIK